VYFQSFIVSKVDKIKNINLGQFDTCQIDVNSWFKINNLTPDNMNEIRQYIFEEWLHKKMLSSKNKISTGCKLVIVYDNPTQPFIDLLKSKMSEIYEHEFCDIVLADE
jgi:hypothetical protein